MRLSLDGKSLVIGSLAGAALVAGVGAMQPDGRSGIRGPKPEGVELPGAPADGFGRQPEEAQPTARGAGAAGRFQIEAVTSGTGTYHAYLIDTATGQVWEYGSQRFALPKLGNGL